MSLSPTPLLFARSNGGVVAAYQRSQLIELRGPVMEQWAQSLSGEEPATAEIIPLVWRPWPNRRKAIGVINP
jgi:hypothetical protein